MKSTTQLDSVVFHLTPTRTRCDLIIIANGKKEKIASGLLNPFLAHLKTAQDQIAKGGYSILLEPDDNDATWFTKGTVERFVRFVSTPEILERVSTLESEILQIEEAIAIQGNNDTGQSLIEEHQTKPAGSGEGNRTKPDPSEEKAIVLYKPEAHQSQTNSECSKEGNSRVQLLKVLETRKTMLRKEQGMAFARAVAASFDIDHMAQLISFADCFGASRLRDACLRSVELWNKKHETGQWVEIEAAEAMSSRTDFSAMNASGIVLASMANKQNDLNGDLGNNEKSEIDISAGERPVINNQAPSGQQEYFQGQFPHPVFPPWPMNTPPGAVPMFPAYPVQGMPYYQAFPGNVPFYQPPYSPMADSRTNATPKTRKKRQSMGDRGSQQSESENSDTPLDGNELDKETSESQASRKKAGQSGKKRSGMVVIRNINYITSEAKHPGGHASESDETGAEGEDFQADDLDPSSNTIKFSKRKGSHSGTRGDSNYETEESFYAKETEGGHWQAFQSFLLSGADEENQSAKKSLFAMENDVKMRRRQNTDSEDPLALGGRDSSEVGDRRLTAIHEASGNGSRKLRVSSDEIMVSGEGSHVVKGLNGQMDMHLAETNGRRVSRNGNDDFIVRSREDQSYLPNSCDPLAVTGVESVNKKVDGASSHDIIDESFIVPFRSMALNQVGLEERTPINMDSEFPSTYEKPEDVGTRNQISYEPDDLSMMPERGTEKRSTGYDPALDYEMLEYDEGSISAQKTKDNVTDAKGNTKRSDKSRNSKVTSETADKRRTGGAIRKGKPSKMSPLEDARARAEKLRAYKADIQKMKKEKEEADLKRLEALKLERQKRIAARASSTVGSTTPLQQQKKLPTKVSPISNRGSKFSDLEPGSSSPLQRSKVRTSLVSNDSNKASHSRTTRSGEGSLLPANRLSRSASSLPEQKKENIIATPESKASMARIRRLSEPKAVGQNSSTSTKGRNSEPVTKQKSDGPDRKKISAIINLDKSKAASLPELKIRTPRVPSDVVQNKSVVRETKLEEAKPSITSECSVPYVENAKLSNQTDADDNKIVEKTVVMLEYEKPSVPVVHASGEKEGAQSYPQFHDHGKIEEPKVVSEFISVRSPPSPNDDRDILATQVQEPSTSCEERTNHAVDSQKSRDNTAEKPYQAPYARISSVEDASTRNSDYGKAVPSISGMMLTTKAYVVNEKTYKVDSIPKASVNDMTYRIDSISEASGKDHGKESSKGFRRLLKFGKKSHNSAVGEQSIDSESESSNGLTQHSNTTSDASNEVYTLKNLISEGDTAISGSASQKSSRHFSLLSPFRIKTSEKKLTT